MKKKGSIYELDGRVELKRAVPLGIQHVLAMFLGNISPLIIVCGLLNIDSSLRSMLIQNSMFVAGVITLVQLYPIGPIGAKLPIVMGTSSGFIGTAQAIGAQYGYGSIIGATLVGGIIELVLGFFIKPLKKLFPPIVTSLVIISIGLSLLPVGIKYFGGGAGAKDFGSLNHLLVGTTVIIVILILKQFKGFLNDSSILIGIIVGYILAMGIMFIATTVETVGDISGITNGGLDREATDRELSGGVMADGVGSLVAAIFGILPNTSFSQNVGLVTVTKIVNRFVIMTGALFLILCGFCPKLSALFSVMPQSVLGGAAVIMFSRENLDARNSLIVALAIGIGVGIGNVPEVLSQCPAWVSNIFAENGIIMTFVVATVLNLILPKNNEQKDAQKVGA